MGKSVINALFIFDANYLSPALVSVASFFDILGANRLPVTLVYLVGQDDAVDKTVRTVLQHFEATITSKHQDASLQITELRGNVFNDYVKRHHFSNAILYKAVIPKVFPHYEHIILFDCGMIFGHQLRDFLKWLEERISSNTISAMAAFCVASDHKDGLSSDLKSIPHNSLYPAGGTLYFDVGRYIHFSIYDRLISAFTLHRDKLIYAEQDLLCLILTDDELSAFHECGVRCHIDLAGLDGWKVIEHYESLYLSRDFFYIKHVGSFKPWKKWVVHPSKAIFLRERKNVEHLLGMENLECLRDSQLIPENLEYLAQQFMLLETLYEKSITLHSS